MIRKLSADTMTVSTYAGTPGYIGRVDGGLTTAQFYMPVHLAFGPSGEFYVADFQNCRVRLVQGNSVSTLAGGMCGYVDGHPASSQVTCGSHDALPWPWPTMTRCSKLCCTCHYLLYANLGTSCGTSRGLTCLALCYLCSCSSTFQSLWHTAMMGRH